MIPDRRRLLDQVEQERGLDPIEQARRAIGRELSEAKLDEPTPTESYDMALVRVLRAARALRDRGQVSGKSDEGLELILALDEAEETGRRLEHGICRECGCIEEDACVDEQGEPCSWNDASETLCSSCRGAT